MTFDEECQHHNSVCSELLRLRHKILEVQVDLSHSHNPCYDLFVLCKQEHSGNSEMRGYACVAHQTNIAKCVFADTIRKHHIDSVPRSSMHTACRRGELAVAPATNAAQSAQPPTSMAERTARERCGVMLRSARIVMGTAPSPARNWKVFSQQQLILFALSLECLLAPACPCRETTCTT